VEEQQPVRSAGRVAAAGKFLRVDGERFLVRGVAYGPFAPDDSGYKFPSPERVSADFSAIARFGFNTIRTYTPPPHWLLDEALRQDIRVIAGLPLPQHVAFLDDRAARRQIRRDVRAWTSELGRHPAVLLIAIGNEIGPPVVRWHGRASVERFLRELFLEGREASPESLLTYVNYPPTEFLELPFFDVCAFNVYLHQQKDLRAYLARLHHVAGERPLLVAEAGADSLSEGEDRQAALVAMQVRVAFEEGACGTVVFTWTDEWWSTGEQVEGWALGLTDRGRVPRPALTAVAGVLAAGPSAAALRRWPMVSVIVCAYNAETTIDECLESLTRLAYPRFEVIVVNDGSKDATGEIARRYASVRVIDLTNGGLGAARNVGLSHAKGEIVAYVDSDVRIDPEWLAHLVQPFRRAEVVAVGGPNAVPPDDPWMAQCVARTPGGPVPVLIDDRFADHVPGCNVAIRRTALEAIGGFDPIFVRAGDDVDVCWRLQRQGGKIAFAPAALLWHHHRATLRAFWTQQVGYGEGEAWLRTRHPDKVQGAGLRWGGSIYSSLPFVRALARTRINTGVWGTAAFPSIYRPAAGGWWLAPHSIAWQIVSVVLLLAAIALYTTLPSAFAIAGAGLLGLSITIGRCIRYALHSEIAGLLPGDHLPPLIRRAMYRATICWLHLVQPVARAWGRTRGRINPAPAAVTGTDQEVGDQLQIGALAARRLWRGLIVLARARRLRFWSERWIAGDAILMQIAQRLRRVHPHYRVRIDDGWQPDRDVSLDIGYWARLDLCALVEDHYRGRCLLRVRMRLRPTAAGLTLALAAASTIAALGAAVSTGSGLALAAILLATCGGRAVYSAGLAEETVAQVAGAMGMRMLGSERRGVDSERIAPAAAAIDHPTGAATGSNT